MKTLTTLLASLIFVTSINSFASDKPDIVYVPSTLPSNTKVPLVVVLHGCAEDASAIETDTAWNQMADKNNFIVLYPNLRNPENKINCWSFYDVKTQTPNSAEVMQIKTAIDTVKAQHSIDASSVFLTGMSAGAAMTSVMVSCYPHEFRAAAAHSGLPYGYSETWQQGLEQAHSGPPAKMHGDLACDPQNFRGPMMAIHGDDDHTVNELNTERIMHDFVETQGNVEQSTQVITPWNPLMHSYKQTDYHLNNQLVGRKVIVHGMGHKWSGGTPMHIFTDPRGPNATQMIWSFFQESLSQ